MAMGSAMRGSSPTRPINVRGTGTNRVPTSNPHGPGASHVSRTPLDAPSPSGPTRACTPHTRYQAWFRGAHLPGSLRLSRKIGSGCHFGRDRRHLIIKRAPIAVGFSTGIGSSWTAARLPGRRASRTILFGPLPPYLVPALNPILLTGRARDAANDGIGVEDEFSRRAPCPYASLSTKR